MKYLMPALLVLFLVRCGHDSTSVLNKKIKNVESNTAETSSSPQTLTQTPPKSNGTGYVASSTGKELNGQNTTGSSTIAPAPQTATSFSSQTDGLEL